MIACNQRELDYSKLQERNEVYYVVNEDKPFNGKAIAYYENGQIERKGNYENGELDGEYIVYYENGQIGVKSNYKNGELHGKFIWYYEKKKIRVKKM